MGDLTVDDLLAATRRSAVTLATDPAVRHYSADTIALVHKRTVLALSGAGSVLKAAARLANDPTLVGVPIEAVEQIMAASYRHFAKAIGETTPVSPSGTTGRSAEDG
jgi:hypothetical protein